MYEVGFEKTRGEHIEELRKIIIELKECEVDELFSLDDNELFR